MTEGRTAIGRAVNDLEARAYRVLESPNVMTVRAEYRAEIDQQHNILLRNSDGFVGAFIFRRSAVEPDEESGWVCNHGQLLFSSLYRYEERHASGLIYANLDALPVEGGRSSTQENELVGHLRELAGIVSPWRSHLKDGEYKLKGNRPLSIARRLSYAANLLLAEGAIEEYRLAWLGELVVCSHQTTGPMEHDDGIRLRQPYLELTLGDEEVEHVYVHDPIHGREIKTRLADMSLRYAGFTSATFYDDGSLAGINLGEVRAHEQKEREMGAFELSLEGLQLFINQLKASTAQT